MLTTIFAIWFGGSTVLCLGLFAAAARPHARPQVEARFEQKNQSSRSAVETFAEEEVCVASHAAATA